MRRHIHNARDLVLPLIDFFYPLFKKIMPLQTYRYAASGGINTLFGFAIYIISFKYVLKEDNLDLAFFVFSPHATALFISFVFSFPFGFFLMKYVVFTDSQMRGKIQLLRYFLVYLFNVALNYIFLKVFVEMLKIDAILSQVFAVSIVIVISYIAQRYFTFKVKYDEENITG